RRGPRAGSIGRTGSLTIRGRSRSPVVPPGFYSHVVFPCPRASPRTDHVMAHYPHVALIVATSKQYDRGLLQGIGRYIKGHGPWSVYIEERGADDDSPGWLASWKGDGIIARIKDRVMADALLATGVPIVELRTEVELGLPTVYCDDTAIGELAVRHFMERGFR